MVTAGETAAWADGFFATAAIKELGEIMVLDRFNMTMWMEGGCRQQFRLAANLFSLLFFRLVAIFGGI